MSVPEILNHLLRHDLPRSLEIFAPELVLCGTIILLLFLRMFGLQKRVPLHAFAILGAATVFLGCFTQLMSLRVVDSNGLSDLLFSIWHITPQGTGTSGPYFTGLLQHDMFAVLMRLLLSLFLVMFCALTILTGVPDDEDSQDFYSLVFGATLAMMMAVGANHLLTVFLTFEMMSLPSYMLVAFQKGKRQASEAALKYVIYGGGAAGVMLYGISLIAGITGTAELPAIASHLLLVMNDTGLDQSNVNSLTFLFGCLLVLAGLAFKLSLVPFHFWAPDAFEGALAEIGGFLSIASKMASFGLLMRVLLSLQGPQKYLVDVSLTLAIVLGTLGIITATYGNLAAFFQNNVKRLLAYSTVAQAGYMIMAVGAFLVLNNVNSPETRFPDIRAAQSVEALIYYLVIYIFMNLVAFGFVAFLRNETFGEEISNYRGLFQNDFSTRIACICLAISFISLIGIPPFAGAFGKLMIFSAVLNAGHFHWFFWVVAAFGIVNSVVSVFYYFRVLKAIFFEEPSDETKPVSIPNLNTVFLVMLTLPIILLGASPLMGDLSNMARATAIMLLNPPL